MRFAPLSLLLAAAFTTACNGNPPARVETSIGGQAATNRQVLTGGFNSVSADGNLFAFTYRDSIPGSIGILNASTNERRVIAIVESGESGSSPMVSPVGDKVAVSWRTVNGDIELRIVPADGSTTRTLFTTAQRFETITPVAWASDNRRLAVLLENLDGTVQIALMDSDQGSYRVLRSLGWNWPSEVSFSADGHYLAYSIEGSEQPSAIYVIATDGAQEVRVSDSSRSEYLLGWDEESGDLLFNTFADGSVSVWRLPMSRGRATGAPQLVRSEVWGMTATGALGIANRSIYFFVSGREMQVMTGTIDLVSGRLISVPTPSSSTYRGDFLALPRWSPDGSHLAYFRNSYDPTVSRIHIRNPAGEERLITVPASYVHTMTWDQSGRSLTLAVTQQGASRILRVDVFTGEFETVDPGEETGANYWLNLLTEESRWRFKTRLDDDGDALLVVDSDSGAERVAWSGASSQRIPSPDGRNLAFRAEVGGSEFSVWMVDAATGEAREVFRPEPGKGISVTGWSADSRTLVISADDDGDKDSLWTVPADGGQPNRVFTSDYMMTGATLHPDGRRFTYTVHTGESGPDAVWALDF